MNNQERMSLAMQENRVEFAVLASAHGFPFRLDNPNPQPKSLVDTIRECERFELEWDFYGGKARVYHIPTGMSFPYS